MTLTHTLRRTACSLGLALAATVLTTLSAAGSAPPGSAAPATHLAAGRTTPSAAPTVATFPTPAKPAGVSAATASGALPACGSIRELPYKRVVRDLGMDAFTVRQYIGWCTDSRGSAWMNFASVYVWDQYDARGFDYRAQVGVAVQGEPEVRGYTVGSVRAQLTYSQPVRTANSCTQGWGKLARRDGESAQGVTTLVC